LSQKKFLLKKNLLKYKTFHSLEENLYMGFCYLRSPQLLKMPIHDGAHHIEDLIDRMIQKMK
tara:strand:- start:129 stop:314 length:186 start_codon:yes stop_codon:yes gene_type:complete